MRSNRERRISYRVPDVAVVVRRLVLGEAHRFVQIMRVLLRLLVARFRCRVDFTVGRWLAVAENQPALQQLRKHRRPARVVLNGGPARCNTAETVGVETQHVREAV